MVAANPRRPPQHDEAGRERRTRSVLFVQGGGKGTHDTWDNKLVASLEKALGGRYSIRYPRMPDEANPDAGAWKKAIDRELRQLEDGVVLVGHSIGGAVLIDHLADGAGPAKPAGIFLIATPFIGDGGWPSDDLRPTEAVAAALSDGAPLYLYQGRDDETVPSSHIELFARAFPRATIRVLEGRNHQLNDDLSELARDISLLE